MSFDVAQDGNLFPREDILEAVAQSDWRDRDVPLIAWVLAGLGVALLAIGLPVDDVVVRTPTAAAADGTAPWLHPVHALAAMLGRAGLGIEAAWFLLSALALGLSLPALRLALRAFEFGGRLSLVAASAALLAPHVFTSGRLPSDFALGVLGSSLLLAAATSTYDSGERGARGYGLRLGLTLALAVLLRPDALAAAPALVMVSRIRTSRWSAAVPTLVVTAAALALAGAGVTVFDVSARTDQAPLLGSMLGLVMVGGSLWLAAPFAWLGRAPEESAPPAWLTVWWISGVLWTIAAAAGAAIAGVASTVVPVFAVLLAATLARRARPDGAARFAAGLIALQVLFAAGNSLALRRTDVAFTESMGDVTRSDTVVLGEDANADAAFLLRRRHGVPVVPADEAANAAADGRRVLWLGAAPSASDITIDPATARIDAEGSMP